METVRYYNARIHTMDEKNPTAEALVVRDGRILFVGGEEESSRIFLEAKQVDLKGKTVMPGFIDAHVHFSMYGESLLKVNIEGLDRQEIFNLIREKTNGAAPGTWVICAGGWDNNKWTDQDLPRAGELDAVSGDCYVVCPKFDGHSIWVNSKVLELVGYDEQTPNPESGEIVRDSQGRLTGWLCGTARVRAESFFPKADDAWKEKVFLSAQEGFFSHGITSVQDAWTELEDVSFLEKLYQGGKMKLRVATAPYVQRGAECETTYKDFYPAGDAYDGRFSNRTLKILVDGSMSSYSAALREDYSDRPGHRGELNYSDEELRQIFTFCANRGYQLMAHCIGDAGIEQYLTILAETCPQAARELRFRMEHFHVCPDDMLVKAKEVGVLLVPNPTHGPFFYLLGPQRLGKRVEKAYGIRRMLDAMGQISFGSDASVTTPSIFLGTYAAVARKDPKGQPEGGYLPQAAVTLDEALHAYTIWNAYAIKQEQNRGSIEVDKYADFVVLSDDPYAVDIDELPRLKVLSTYVAGEKVYEA